MNLKELCQIIDKANWEKEDLEKKLVETEKTIKELFSFRNSLEEATLLIQTAAKETQEQLRFHIEDIVQLALDATFPGYKFKIEFELKRGRTEARIFILDQGQEEDPIDAGGGGLVDIISFALRFAAWSLSKTDKVIIMDEPFKFLDKDRKPLAMEILKQLSDKLSLQIITVTHDQEMVEIADKIFKVDLVEENGFKISRIREILK